MAARNNGAGNAGGSSGRRNMSSMRPVMRKPPAMFTALIATAATAATPTGSFGTRPPRMSSSAPMAVMPLMALVTLMRGE